MKLFLNISFKGSAYKGYQVQNNAPTVQQMLNEASLRVFGFDCDIVGCSRTDSGVHANEFCITVTQKGKGCIEHSIPIEKIPAAFNSVLPEDIAVNFAKTVDDDFHARYSVKYKEYVYKMWNGKSKNPFLHDTAYHIPFNVSKDSVLLMNEAAQKFVGKHDFTSFMAQGSKITDAVRTVFYSSVSIDKNNENLILFTVAADGFLYNMVRIMAGTLIDVARGNISPLKIDSIIESKERRCAGATAPAHGLFLNKVSYSEYKGENYEHFN